jgi:hypothetical protein
MSAVESESLLATERGRLPVLDNFSLSLSPECARYRFSRRLDTRDCTVPRASPKTLSAKRSHKPAATSRIVQSPFKPLERSVYIGRGSLGRYVRVAGEQYKAHEVGQRLIGRFSKRTAALATMADGAQ